MKTLSLLFSLTFILIFSSCSSDSLETDVQGYVTNGAIFDANVSIYSPTGALIGIKKTDSDGFYILNNAPYYPYYIITAEGGFLDGEEYRGTLKGQGSSDSCNATPFSTVVSDLADYDAISYEKAQEELFQWLDIQKDPFIAAHKGEPLPNVNLDALGYAIQSEDKGVNAWSEKVLGAFTRGIEPNPMWIEITGLLQGDSGASKSEAQLIWDDTLNHDRGETLIARINMKFTEENGRSHSRKLYYYRQQKDILNRKVFIHFLSPADIVNTTYLTIMENGLLKRWIYLSSFRKVRKIVRKDLAYAFVDTDFTYEDIEFFTSGTYSASNLREPIYNEQAVYELTLEKNDEYSTYSSIEVTILKDSLTIAKAVMYSKEDPTTPYKELVFSDFELFDGYLTPKNISITNLNSNTKTELEINNAQYNQELPPETFTVRNMEK